MVEKEKKDLGLRTLVSSVEKDIELLNVLTLERRLEVIVESLWLVKKLLKCLMNLKMVRTQCEEGSCGMRKLMEKLF